MTVDHFEDIVAITALARPGPLHSGGTYTYIERRMGREPIEYMSNHPAIIARTKDTYGVVVYQETIMMLGREFGDLSWEDVSELRKAMSKTYGDEFFAGYREKFIAGAVRNGVTAEEGERVWKGVSTFGSWAFNKSHAISYGLISYWCAWLKAHHPLAFAKANLNHARDTPSATRLLREFNYPYIPFSAKTSGTKWEVADGTLVGPLTNVKGIGEKKAIDIIQRREKGIALLPGQLKLITEGTTPYDDLYPIKSAFGEYYTAPGKKGIKNGHTLTYIKDIHEDGMYLLIGRLVDRNLRDLNEYGATQRRGGKTISGQTLFLALMFEDDTDSITASIGRYQYEQYGKEIAESGKIGVDCYLIYGEIKDKWRKVHVRKIQKISS